MTIDFDRLAAQGIADFPQAIWDRAVHWVEADAARLEADLQTAVVLQRFDMIGRLHVVVDGIDLMRGRVASSLQGDVS